MKKRFTYGLDSTRFVKAKSGIYILYDKKLEPIFIGATDNLQRQFTKYADTNFENDPCKQKTHAYQRTFIENSKERQTQLLDEYKKKHGIYPSYNKETR